MIDSFFSIRDRCDSSHAGPTYTLCIGRWCPFHEGHKYLVDALLAGGRKVAIAIRNSPDEIPIEVRMEMIHAVYVAEVERGDVVLVRIPDIDLVCVGRNVGYGIMQVPDDIRTISGTEIRAGRQQKVPQAAQEVWDRWHTRQVIPNIKPIAT